MGSFADQIARFAAETKDKADAVVHETVLDVGQRLIDRSPIDTGRFKSNWRYGLETPDRHTTTETNQRKLQNTEELPKAAGGFVHYVTNSLPYGPALERGHSKQAPQGMVALTALEFSQIVSDAVLIVDSRNYVALTSPRL
jgi:hypothetical protein